MRMFTNFWNNIKESFDGIESLLAWLAIFIWYDGWVQTYTSISPFSDLIKRIFGWDWDRFTPINTESGLMITASVSYWIGTIIVLIVAVRLFGKLFATPKENRGDNQLDRKTATALIKAIQELTEELRNKKGVG